eukprot:471216-Prymnesium_polylepis.1
MRRLVEVLSQLAQAIEDDRRVQEVRADRVGEHERDETPAIRAGARVRVEIQGNHDPENAHHRGERGVEEEGDGTDPELSAGVLLHLRAGTSRRRALLRQNKGGFVQAAEELDTFLFKWPMADVVADGRCCRQR